jgi:hypothetical protein
LRRERGLSTVVEIALIGAGILAVLIIFVVVARVSTRARPTAPLEPDPKAYVTLRAPRGEVVAPPREFAWRAVEGAARYRVKISDEDALWPLFVKTLDRGPLVLDDKEVKAITPGRIHIWEVDALDAAGQPIARGTSRFRFTPP